MKLKISGFESSLLILCSPLMDSASLDLPQTTEEWEQWLKLAVLNRVEAQVFKSLQRRHLQIPENIKSVLEKRAQQVIEQNQKRRQEAQTLFARLKQENIDFLILKGNALAHEIYQDPDYKQMNDFDLLFKTTDLDRLFSVYSDLKYVSAASLNQDFRKQEKHSHHWPPFFSRNMNLFIGTHWNLVSPYSSAKISADDLWATAETFSYTEQTMRRLGKENFLLHLCVHLSAFKLGLKELADLYNFIFYFKQQIQWPLFLKKVRQTNAQDSVYRAFAILQSLFESHEIAEVCQQLKPLVSKKLEQEIKLRTEPAKKFFYLRTAQVSKIEKNFGFFSLSDAPLEKAYFLFKMWKNYLWAPREECFRLCHEIPSTSLSLRFRVSLKAIGQINQSFISDLGAPVFILVTLSHHVNLAKAILRKSLGFPCENIQAKAQRLGLSLTDLKSLSQLE